MKKGHFASQGSLSKSENRYGPALSEKSKRRFNAH
jgi:hypothetical protein